jgi:hypothetical protein
MSTVPPTGSARKRPWYLLVALLGAWLFGAAGMASGWDRIEFYRMSKIDPTAISEIADDATRANVLAAHDHYVAAMDAGRAHIFPLGVASFVLGIAMWIVAGSAMTGRRGARTILIQVLLAQAVLLGVDFFVTRDVRAREMELALVFANARQVTADKEQLAQAEKITAAIMRIAPPFVLAGQVLARGLIIIALTRPRSREFFEAASSQMSEQ